MTRCALAIISGLAVLAVLGYNLWAYCCGRCAAENFVQLGPYGLLLTGVTLAAGLALLLLKACRIRNLRLSRCRCGSLPAPGWDFCPRCGTSLKAT
ncbi:MAG: hypothetical protein GWO11_00725 [Desulfuromonadales bacterium]|nr:hypothetical protein [Desulfuromonadales bacterium]NIR33043.1 hypothetical protein [Desulfuromonadales bacterium]NIS43062.1 hypothetical protein [Desulfuromonadales bacterium]